MKNAIISVLVSPLLLMAQQGSAAWTNIGPGPAGVKAIAVDPYVAGTIFMGSIAGGVRKSVDSGITCSAANTGLTNLKVLALAMDASGPQTVYAAVGGLFKTGDGGATWQNIAANSGGDHGRGRPEPVRRLRMGLQNLANGSSGRASTGVTWATIFLTTAVVFDITIDPGNSDVL